MSEKSNILGVGINKLKKQEFTSLIKTSLKEEILTKIFTPNTDMILKAHSDSSLRSTLLSADILIADGAGLVIGSKLLGDPLPDRIAGIDAAEDILSIASENKLKVFLLGGNIGIAQSAKRNIEEKFSGVEICGTHHGYFDVHSKENKLILKKINASSPDILFVCMGFPRQELWICENCTKLPSVKIAMGLGGSLDVWAKKTKRAPKVLQYLCLEWLWRIIREPHRIGFIRQIPAFFMAIWRQKTSASRAKADI